jgi:hypothetical protein
MHAEGLSAERHEYGTGTEVYASEQQAVMSLKLE